MRQDTTILKDAMRDDRQHLAPNSDQSRGVAPYLDLFCAPHVLLASMDLLVVLAAREPLGRRDRRLEPEADVLEVLLAPRLRLRDRVVRRAVG